MQIRSQLSQTRCFSGFFIPGKKKKQTFASLSASKWKNIVKCLSLVKKKKDSSFTNKTFRNSTVHFSVTLCYLKFKINESISLCCRLVSNHQFILSPIFSCGLIVWGIALRTPMQVSLLSWSLNVNFLFCIFLVAKIFIRKLNLFYVDRSFLRTLTQF